MKKKFKKTKECIEWQIETAENALELQIKTLAEMRHRLTDLHIGMHETEIELTKKKIEERKNELKNF